jgi:3-phenylpropionate/trans-cinnamate dioxygenase ferredoxin reductase subunit
MNRQNPVIVIGGGLAGASYAAELRRQGFQDPITIIDDEGRMPYDRPPLSKEYLLTGDPASTVIAMPELASCEFILGDAVSAIDPGEKTIALSSGRKLPYGTLVFATGATAKSPPSSLTFPAPVHRLRTMADADRLREVLAPGRHLVIIGGGIIGLEVAATARKLGAKVTVIEAAKRLLSRNACEDLATFLQTAHEKEGVEFKFGGFTSVGPEGFELADGTRVRPDTILWATGAAPNEQLARSIGVECQEGILADEVGRTNLADVYAVGDVVRLRTAGAEGIARHETWTAAREQAEYAARALVSPDYVPKATAFYYWTDQYAHKIQVVGSPIGEENIVVPGEREDSFSIYHLIGGRLGGVSLINNPKLMPVAKRAILKGPALDAAAVQAPNFNLRSLA